MNFFESKKLPGGKPSKLASAKEVLPAEQIKSHVVWENPAFEHAPFNFNPKDEEPPKLSIFLTPSPDAEHSLIIESGHGRSGIVGRVLFQDEEGRFYLVFKIKMLLYITKT